MKLPRSFYTGAPVIDIARELLGKRLMTRVDGRLSAGIIIETEAYTGIEDRASHAYGGRRTRRTEVMYRQGGTAYVYLCYGLHALFNVVTNVQDVPEAVLVRGIKLCHGDDAATRRMARALPAHGIIVGPGRVSRAMGIEVSHTGVDLLGDSIWIEDAGWRPAPESIRAGPRVGIAYAGPDALLPYRFLLEPSGIEV